jgi:hypothetical protein
MPFESEGAYGSSNGILVGDYPRFDLLHGYCYVIGQIDASRIYDAPLHDIANL